MPKLMVILIAVLALVIIAAFTPVVPWLTGTPSPVVESPQPTITPVESPQPTTTPVESPTTPPAVVEPSPSVEVPSQEKVRKFSEEELQSKLDGLSEVANQSGAAKVEYIHIELEQDRMLVSAGGEAMGIHAETKDLAVWFEGRTVFAEGKVSALGFSPTLTAKAEVSCEGGKPSANVTEFRLSGLANFALKASGLSEAKISSMVNSAIETAEIELPADLESIRIEDGKLIVVFK